MRIRRSPALLVVGAIVLLSLYYVLQSNHESEFGDLLREARPTPAQSPLTSPSFPRTVVEPPARGPPSSGPSSASTEFVARTPSPPDADGRVNACILVLARNSDLDGLSKSIEIFERQFNAHYGYPYVFLNDAEFSADFLRRIVEHMTFPDRVEFGRVPTEHWSYPPWISKIKAAKTREDMRDIIYGDSESYRFMCHYQSGYFFRHPLLLKYDFYWRLEPDTKLVCQVPYDPFRYLYDNGIKYGFTIAIGEYKETVLSLWEATMNYAAWKRKQSPDFNPTLLNFFASDDKKEYNLRHYWSNFEIADLNFWRSSGYVEYFDHLDRFGGFFYERWGDAPVHSLGLALFAKYEEVHFFEDIGYYHAPLTHCPAEPYFKERKCDCERDKSADLIKNWACIDQWRDYRPAPFF